MTTGKNLSIVILFSLLAACGSEDEKATPDIPGNGSAPAQAQPAVAPTPAPANNQAPPNQNIALNPAHGLPGHRCDIAVGAPLNSPPSNTVQPTAPVQATPVQAAPVQAAPANNLTPSKGVINTNAAATGLNPAHGQPGHRCEIPVGAPLNSQPAKQ